MSLTFHTGNRYLSRAEMEDNANYIASYLLARGWSLNAIAAILGNMESESGINPGIYENLDSNSTTNGYGLVQWTPNTKYKEWAFSRGYTIAEIGRIVPQLDRIIYEVKNGLQWIETDAYPMSFTAFTKDTQTSVEELAQAFMYNYERPATLNQPQRSSQARSWYSFITGGSSPPTPTPEPTPKPKKEMSKLLLYYAGTRRV